ncbi:LytR/AlgR family response regulator transcription factor [Aquisalimonas asiatica]|uniref:Two component transcriptional regulator, LytTR family n=1 Tax=Aquisalimonas asiatica TaxID=406100 RepID=A0A1H8SW18_9GAMM|nr:LytTR family DNA-binding domain-containing protein [Aquisalimonas asiatica]SEO82862.1 two component transcriptional regulator, LytTR family [Aquisalimonas asiatica]
MSVTAVIADDEAELAAHLQRQLAAAWPELDVAGIARNGPEALELLERERPDVAFLDIRMPGLSGLEVAKRLTAQCRVVFVTAFDHYAVEAFEQEAVDYLLKPVTPERLARTVERLRRPSAPTHDPAALSALLERLQGPKEPEYLQWIRAGLGERVQLVAVNEVFYFHASAKYTSVVTAGDEVMIRTPIKALADQLDPQRFWQIHRGTIVNASVVEAVHREFGGRLSLTLRGRPESLTVSRPFVHLFRQM